MDELALKIADQYREKWGKLKIDLGAGEHPRGEDFIPVDPYDSHALIAAPMWELPFETDSVDEIWSSHALEHLSREKAILSLHEMMRVLRDKGRAILQVPNFDYVARYWFIGPDREWAQSMVFGYQRHAGDYHHCCFNPGSFRATLEGVGFKVISIKIVWAYNQETLQAVCIKPERNVNNTSPIRESNENRGPQT